VNWFRKDATGKFLRPGYGQNSRVLAWVFGRCTGATEAVDTAIGRLPAPGALPTEVLDVSDDAITELLAVDRDAWRAELPLIDEHYALFGERLPNDLRDELDALAKRLSAWHVRVEDRPA
jgi:phosphoenolpyruvate carboxykinase (GTP)